MPILKSQAQISCSLYLFSWMGLGGVCKAQIVYGKWYLPSNTHTEEAEPRPKWTSLYPWENKTGNV